MLTATDARRLLKKQTQEEQCLDEIENKIKEAATNGQSEVSIRLDYDYNVNKFVMLLESLGFVASWKFAKREVLFNISWSPPEPAELTEPSEEQAE